MPTITFPNQVGSLTAWFADNEFKIYKEFIQQAIKGKSRADSDAWLDEVMAGGKQQEFETWLQTNHPAELEMYNIVRYR